MLVNFNGNIINDYELGFDKLYRATMFGDGLFESIYVEGKSIYMLDEHLKRLYKGMAILDLQLEKVLSNKKWLENISLISKEYLQFKFLRVRIMVWRNGRGTYNTSGETKANFIIFCEEALEMKVRKVTKVGVSTTIKLANSWYTNNKTLNALNYVGASVEKIKNGLDEILLTNENGQIAEAGASNIICIQDNLAIVPKNDSGKIQGVMIDFITTYIKSLNFKIEERNLFEKDISLSDIVIFSNSFSISLLINKKRPNLTDKIKDTKMHLPKQQLLL